MSKLTKSKKGTMALVPLVLGLVIALILYVLGGVIAGQTVQVTQSSIASIGNGLTDNGTWQSVEQNITLGLQNGFVAYSQTGQYFPLVVLGQVLAIILATIFTAIAVVNFGGRGGEGAAQAL